MATVRNPEETKKKILDVAQKLFAEKGYDNTSIQDIIDGLGGMTKGAIYHHFKSKFDILDTLLNENSKKDLETLEEGKTGLESLKNIFLMSLKGYSAQSITYSATVTLKSPRMIGEQFLTMIDIVEQVIRPYLDIGIKDGSIQTEYPEEVAEILMMYMNLRVGLYLPELSKEEFMRKIKFMKFMLENLGVPIFDYEIISESEKLYDYLHQK